MSWGEREETTFYIWNFINKTQRLFSSLQSLYRGVRDFSSSCKRSTYNAVNLTEQLDWHPTWTTPDVLSQRASSPVSANTDSREVQGRRGPPAKNVNLHQLTRNLLGRDYSHRPFLLRYPSEVWEVTGDDPNPSFNPSQTEFHFWFYSGSLSGRGIRGTKKIIILTHTSERDCFRVITDDLDLSGLARASGAAHM